MEVKPVEKCWSGLCIVAATGPSLTAKVAELCRGHHIIAINDAYRLIPWAEVLYACDGRWWQHHNGCPNFIGEKWTSWSSLRKAQLDVAEKYQLRLVQGVREKHRFSFDAQHIHYGHNSGFQAINLALLLGGNPIALIGFDNRLVKGKRHFFGDHTGDLRNTLNFTNAAAALRQAALALPSNIEIFNCTPGSTIDAFPMRDLREVLNGFAACHPADRLPDHVGSGESASECC